MQSELNEDDSKSVSSFKGEVFVFWVEQMFFDQNNLYS